MKLLQGDSGAVLVEVGFERGVRGDPQQTQISAISSFHSKLGRSLKRRWKVVCGAAHRQHFSATFQIFSEGLILLKLEFAEGLPFEESQASGDA